jgi:hypothetical protein
MFEFPDSLRLPHDVIDPDKLTGKPSVTYPVLLALLYGSTPPANLARRLLLNVKVMHPPLRGTSARAQRGISSSQ